ncbi:MAG TPA: 3-keto-5-aminohexanoate cleavage protein [Candidatus Limnocylindrales bacterium]|nr:3-keto-5-aminohexanoate cleavage protein [Candidatus Limnocylindrales bacterium]
MSLDDKVVVTCALTGAIANKVQCPHIPYTPEEIGEEARRAYEAGAAVVHIHAREDDGSPTIDVEAFRRIHEAVRKRSPVLINFSTGAINVSREQRIAHIPVLKPEIAALNMGTMNYAKYSPRRKDFVFSMEFLNPIPDIMYYIQTMMENGVQPECECFDVGHLETVYPLIDMGLLKNFQVSCILGVGGAIQATARNLVYMTSRVPDGIPWQVIGVSTEQWMLCSTALALGGNIRVGLEDNFYLSSGVMAEGNGPLVEKAVRMARDIGREPASVEETKKLLKLC